MIQVTKNKRQPNEWDVRLEGKLVGKIFQSSHTAFHYIPKGQKQGGEYFKSLSKCINSLIYCNHT